MPLFAINIRESLPKASPTTNHTLMSNSPVLKYAAALALASAAAVPQARAEHDSALIDILQRKGVLSQKEAAAVREELAHSSSKDSDSASRIKLSSAVTELRLYGDLRLRYQYESKDTQFTREAGGGSNVSQQSRWRFRLRLNADFKLGDRVFGGVELQTAQASDSANQTFENGFSDYNIFISKAYMGWHVNDWLTVTGGKFTNPFYSTELVWDPDINPTGVAEVIAFHKMVDSGGVSGGGYSKDGKTYQPAAASALPWELSLVAGQFIFDDNRESNGPDTDLSTDAYLFETQLIGSYKFGSTKLTVAPGWLTYINGSLSDVENNNSFNDPIAGLGGTRNLNLLLVPGDLSFKLGSLKTKFFWDFSYNFDAEKRVEDIYAVRNLPGRASHATADDFAYLVGVQFGENKKAGDWSFLANWRQTGLGAVDPNLNDSDFAQSELNTRGVETGLAYNFTDFAIGAVTYDYAWNLRDSRVDPFALGDANVSHVLQVDISVKF